MSQNKTDLGNQQFALTQRIWNGLNKNTIESLNEYYDENVHFLDAFSDIKGRVPLKKYYAHLYRRVESIHFDFIDVVAMDNHQFFSWKMHLQSPGLNNGKGLEVTGTSHIKFSPESGKVIYHRDYFDSGEFIYQNIPGLKWIHAIIKKRMHPKFD